MHPTRTDDEDRMACDFIDHFASVSGSYARFRPTYPSALFAWLESVAPTRQRAWDCATGTGQCALALAERFETVLATDASASQLALAEPHPRVRYRLATAEHSGLLAHSMDLVTVAQALHWFDRDRFYREVERVLRPGGVLAAWTYGLARVEAAGIDAILRHFYGEIVGPYWPPEKVLVDNDYRDITLPCEALATPAFAMETFWNLEQLLGYCASWSATARYVAATGSDPLEWIRPAMQRAWGERERQYRLRWPLTLKACRRSPG
ncbi:class I SAM-dependent methyltransferase [Cyanobium gracile]|uniref:Class I SAM-dependent methyltransferase n=1 Tax=Cyanobium gracile UHCC 0281 TaxID=3110309 RepID=A0ABU5SYE2_9CYAN|nr:class I SAM-dependent methyltransferase [Cyanobium gracile]MEA5443545.1 class I SAM-dependent methyltransferase [Cyanobium gracile UHCC 0281]